MIVRHSGDALQLITQPDHARLAGAVMQHWVALAEHPRRTSILLAVAEHDNGWAEPDAAPQADPETGIPLDFIGAPIAVRQAVWPRGVARLAHDPWAAALVAQHAIAIFERYRSDGAWTQFLEEMEGARRSMLTASGLSFDELQADYRFVGLGDLVSLTFCNGWTEVQPFDTWRVRLIGERVFVGPDPFEGNTFPIAIDAREIPRRAYRRDAELHQEIAAARVTTLHGVASGNRNMNHWLIA